MKKQCINFEAYMTQLFNKGQINDKSVNSKDDKYLNITPDTGKLLYFIVKSTSSKKVLELGTSNGYSTAWLSLGAEKVITVENNHKKILEAKEHLETMGLSEKIDFIEKNAADYLSENSNLFDLIFIDMDRSLYMDTLFDVNASINIGGILIYDNAISHQNEMIELIQYFEESSRHLSTIIPTGKGELIVLKIEN